MSATRLLWPYRSRKSVRFQIMSDLHLEVGQQYSDFHIIPRATRLILAGDIGRLADYEAFRNFLRIQCKQFVEVYLVLGNHEFFGVSRQEGLRLADMLQQEPELKDKLIIMNRTRVDLQDITLLGCTLHSQIPPEAEEIVRYKINDFRRIADWTVADHNAEHARDVKWLADEITSIRKTESGLKRKIVVISHHAPSTKGTSKSSDECNPWNSAFATCLLGRKEISCLDDVQWWIFGHTHNSTELICGQVKLVSNQRGYVLPNKEKNGSQISGSFPPTVLNLWGYGRQKQNVFNAWKTIEV
ncbi:serine/threonine phosphatase [Histoplasma capsulatum G186AR]|nr:serine/threonine phosphatase [Histoplasma capsulatum]QSS76394.1 serine/threonine phosphatase [Histoplasma capsulatum G186AR]